MSPWILLPRNSKQKKETQPILLHPWLPVPKDVTISIKTRSQGSFSTQQQSLCEDHLAHFIQRLSISGKRYSEQSNSDASFFLLGQCAGIWQISLSFSRARGVYTVNATWISQICPLPVYFLGLTGWELSASSAKNISPSQPSVCYQPHLLCCRQFLPSPQVSTILNMLSCFKAVQAVQGLSNHYNLNHPFSTVGLLSKG